MQRSEWQHDRFLQQALELSEALVLVQQPLGKEADQLAINAYFHGLRSCGPSVERLDRHADSSLGRVGVQDLKLDYFVDCGCEGLEDSKSRSAFSKLDRAGDSKGPGRVAFVILARGEPYLYRLCHLADV